MRLRLALALGGAVATALALVVACGIEEGGVLDAPGNDGQASDVVVPSGDGSGIQDVLGIDTALPPSCGDAAPCLGAVPDPWQIVAVLSDPDASCPMYFATTDLVEDFTLSAGACACGCADQGDAGCGLSVLNCGNGGAKCAEQLGCAITDGGCAPIVHNQGNWLQATTPLVKGISCAPTQAPPGVDSVPVRVCEPTCAASDFCSAASAAAATACLIVEGDVACPTYRTFSKQLLGSAATAACLPCAGCNSPKNFFCGGTMDFYGDTACTPDASFSLTIDNGCHAGPGGNSGKAIALTVTPPAGPYCAGLAISPGTGDAGPVGPKTLCCP